MDLVKQIEEEKIIAIIRGVKKEKIVPLVTALYNGGIRFVEVTFPQGEDGTDTVESIKAIADNFNGKVHVGAGTVLTPEQVEFTKKVGGEFIVSPDTYESVISKTKELGMVSIPGAYSPTEITTAVRLGADFVKLFPASNLGVNYIKAIRSPLKGVKLLAFGGIDLKNIKDYLTAGVCGFGIGANIVDKNSIEKGDFNRIEKLAEKYCDTVKKFI